MSLGANARIGLRNLGLGFHKDEYADCIISLGHEISPESFGVRPCPSKLMVGAGAIEQLLIEKEETAETIESLVSFISWLQLVCRPLMSFWREVYFFINANRGKGTMRLPECVLSEFRTALCLLTFTSCSMRLGWNNTVYITDSCFKGAGVL